jgi:hypothetical protein
MSLRDVSPEAIEQRLHELRSMADEYATAFSRAAALDEGRKSMVAKLMKKAELNGHRTSAAQEREALADPEYETLLKGLEVAVHERERLRWLFKVAELTIGVYQTMRADRRLEHKTYGA